MIKKLLVLFLVLSTYGLRAQSLVEEGKDVFYEIFIRSFYDTNEDGIGDINGITQKLDYLKNLGITGIWITPVHPSPTYHKYDVKDYKNIDPEYGNLEDYKKLLEAAHKRGIKILMDLVVNHTSTEHPWFKEAVNGNPAYKNYYVWSKDSVGKYWYKPKKSNNKENYYAFFWKGMPDLNFDFPPVRSEIYAIGKFWLELGVDGFRLDAAQHIYDAIEVQKNIAWWNDFRREMQKVNPQVFLLGEVWNKDSIVAAYLESSLHSCFNFDISSAIPAAIRQHDGKTLLHKLTAVRKCYSKYNSNFTDAIFLTNHDQDRIASILGNDTAQVRLAATILMTLPGTPFIYYGEEFGMGGKFPDPLRREPLTWKQGRRTPGNTYWEKNVYNKHKKFIPVAQQIRDSLSIYHFYKSLISLRMSEEALQKGQLEVIAQNDPTLMVYKRVLGHKTMYIIHNLSENTKTWERPNMSRILFQSNGAGAGEGILLNLPPYSSAILGD